MSRTASPSRAPAVVPAGARRACGCATPFVRTAIEELAPAATGSRRHRRLDGRHPHRSRGGSRNCERRPVAPLLHAGSGSAYWYLVLKNWVIASGIHPRYVLIFFRDTNLTNVMYRLDEQFRWMIDLRGARTRGRTERRRLRGRRRAVVSRPARRRAARTGPTQARALVEPAMTELVGKRPDAARRRKRTEFMTNMNARFGLDHLRPMEAADLQAGGGPTRRISPRRRIDSVLPLMLRDASRGRA